VQPTRQRGDHATRVALAVDAIAQVAHLLLLGQLGLAIRHVPGRLQLRVGHGPTVLDVAAVQHATDQDGLAVRARLGLAFPIALVDLEWSQHVPNLLERAPSGAARSADSRDTASPDPDWPTSPTSWRRRSCTCWPAARS